MSAREPDKTQDMQFGMLVISLVVVVALFLLGAYTLFQHGASMVHAQDDTVGEMLLDEGLRRLAGGAEKEARVYFRLAEAARFEGTKNKRHLQKVWGDLMLAEGNAELAGSYYADATQDWALHVKDPSALAEAYALHAEMLLAGGALDELASYLESKPVGGEPEGEALIAACKHYYEVLLAVERGEAATLDLYGGWADAALYGAVSDDPELVRLGLLAPIAPVRERAARQLSARTAR